MNEHIVKRRPDGTILPGYTGNPLGRPPLERPRFDRNAIIARCVQDDYEPIRALIALSRSPDASPYLQFAVHKELSEYLYAKRKTVLIGDEEGGGNEIKISWETRESTEANTAPPKPDKASKQFDRKMRHAHQTVIDAVLTDGDDNGND